MKVVRVLLQLRTACVCALLLVVPLRAFLLRPHRSKFVVRPFAISLALSQLKHNEDAGMDKRRSAFVETIDDVHQLAINNTRNLTTTTAYSKDTSTVLQTNTTATILDALHHRRTIHQFDASIRVPDHVVRAAVQAAIYAPNHGMTEPWRFVQLGPKTIRRIATLNAKSMEDKEKAAKKLARWQAMPGWCVVTCQRSPDNELLELEDYAACCCATHNFCLAMHAQGVGTKWTTGPVTRTREFAEICKIDVTKELVVGCLWYGYAKDGLASAGAPLRRKGVDDVLCQLP
jgi:nitroreductase